MKPILFVLEGQPQFGSLGTKITKHALYGYAKRVVEKEGITLTKGYLTPEGKILQRQQIDYAKLDPEGSPIAELISEIDGEVATLLPSAFEQENVLTPVPLKELIGFSVSDVYPIDIHELTTGLYRTQFSYRKSYAPKEALLLKKEDGSAFLLIGERKNTPFVGLQVTYDFFDADDEDREEDELDFAMV